MSSLTLSDIEQAAARIYQHMPATPQYSWPLLNQRVGTTVWVKHENMTITGAFKVRGAITFMHWLRNAHPEVRGIVTATRGNHGQGQARAATAAGLSARVYVPRGNSVEKNAAMRAFGAELIEHGDDFDEARAEAMRVAESEGLFPVPPFHPELVRGVATYAWELLSHAPNIDTIYVPIGCGSGICGTIAARDALALSTKVVGVVSERATTAKIAYETGELITTDSANTFADGVAVRAPVPEAVAIYRGGAERIVTVSDDQISEAVRVYASDTHSMAEGAGAVALAALLQERERMRDKEVAVILTGANMDSNMYQQVLAGQTPRI